MLCDQVLNSPANGFVVIEFRNGTSPKESAQEEKLLGCAESFARSVSLQSGLALGHGGKDPGRMPVKF